jgi:hypothetical protein
MWNTWFAPLFIATVCNLAALWWWFTGSAVLAWVQNRKLPRWMNNLIGVNPKTNKLRNEGAISPKLSRYFLRILAIVAVVVGFTAFIAFFTVGAEHEGLTYDLVQVSGYIIVFLATLFIPIYKLERYLSK